MFPIPCCYQLDTTFLDLACRDSALIGTLLGMGLVNARNLRKAKELLEKNRHKVGDAVGKATTKIDEVSGGKTSNLSKKAEDAARKYSAGGVTIQGAPDVAGHVAPTTTASAAALPPDADMSSTDMSEAQAQRRETEASIAEANALTEAANRMLAQAAQIQAKLPKDPPPPES
jgi:hypothetical protein